MKNSPAVTNLPSSTAQTILNLIACDLNKHCCSSDTCLWEGRHLNLRKGVWTWVVKDKKILNVLKNTHTHSQNTTTWVLIFLSKVKTCIHFFLSFKAITYNLVQCEGLPPIPCPLNRVTLFVSRKTGSVCRHKPGCWWLYKQLEWAAGSTLLASSVHLQHVLKYTLYVYPLGSAENKQENPSMLERITGSIRLY